MEDPDPTKVARWVDPTNYLVHTRINILEHLYHCCDAREVVLWQFSQRWDGLLSVGGCWRTCLRFRHLAFAQVRPSPHDPQQVLE